MIYTGNNFSPSWDAGTKLTVAVPKPVLWGLAILSGKRPEKAGFLTSATDLVCGNCRSHLRFYRVDSEGTFFSHCGNCLKTLIVEDRYGNPGRENQGSPDQEAGPSEGDQG